MWGGTSGSGGQWNEQDEEQPIPLVDHEHPVDHSWSKDATDLRSVFPDAIPANQMASEHKLVSEERYQLQLWCMVVSREVRFKLLCEGEDHNLASH